MAAAGAPPGIVQFHVPIGSPDTATEPSVRVVITPKQGVVGIIAAVGKPPTVRGYAIVAEQPAVDVIVRDAV